MVGSNAKEAWITQALAFCVWIVPTHGDNEVDNNNRNILLGPDLDSPVICGIENMCAT